VVTPFSPRLPEILTTWDEANFLKLRFFCDIQNKSLLSLPIFRMEIMARYLENQLLLSIQIERGVIILQKTNYEDYIDST